MTSDVRPVRPALRVPRAGWRVIAAKEFGDHLLSVRFIVLLVVLGLAAAIPLYFAADRIRARAPAASGAPAVFLALFTLGSQQIDSAARRRVRRDRGAAARPRVRVRCCQRRARRGDAAPSAGPADLSRRRDQRQVRCRPGDHRARPGRGHRVHRRLRDAPARHRAARLGEVLRLASLGLRHVRVRRAMARVRAAPVGR